MAEIDRLLGALKFGEKLMQGGQCAVQLGTLAAERIREKKCAICGEEPIVDGSPVGPIGAACAKRYAGGLIDLLVK